MDKYIFIGGTLLLTAFGQILIKFRALTLGGAGSDRLAYLKGMFLDPPVWLGLGGAVLASVCWILALQKLDVSVAYPFMALSFLIVPLGASITLGETVSLQQWVGFGLIVLGVSVAAGGVGR